MHTRQRVNNARIIYPAGLLSLLLLPLLCLYYLNRTNAFVEYRAIELVWWDPSLHKTYPELFPFETHPPRDYLKIYLTGEENADRAKLDSAQNRIRELVRTKDTKKGVHFIFGNNSKYWAFIQAINICNIEEPESYIPYKNNIWVFINNSEPSTFVCGTSSLMGDIVAIKSNDKTLHKQVKEYVFENLASFWLPGLLFLVMTILTLRNLRILGQFV